MITTFVKGPKNAKHGDFIKIQILNKDTIAKTINCLLLFLYDKYILITLDSNPTIIYSNDNNDNLMINNIILISNSSTTYDGKIINIIECNKANVIIQEMYSDNNKGNDVKNENI